MDPLEDVLALTGASSYVSAGMVAGGRWAVRFEAPGGVKFNSVRRGSCLVHVDGSEPIRLREDDAFLLTQPRGFVLASAEDVSPVPASLIFREAAARTGEREARARGERKAEAHGEEREAQTRGDERENKTRAERETEASGGERKALTRGDEREDQRRGERETEARAGERVAMARAGVGDDVEVIGGGFTFNERGRTLLLPNLPPILHVPGDAPEAATVRWVLQRIGAELGRGDVGATVVAEHLAMVMFVEVLRLHLRSGGAAGWLAGLADPVVAEALRAMHRRPAHPWTVTALAHTARVSRSTLAARFKDLVGTGPVDYLTGWRIEIAAQRLTETSDTLSTIARQVGYGSESALSTAFKRVTGQTPRDYRRG
ncbi:cupin domain-containing protein [Symbioplanes lichenis]|uniref:cupin domain-containing protein n=1 Tax=Symbioplanes lichenis TaxID=1629072 RepID=UPI0027391242|nr:cupin domain-containing protein [Actinoplanes lichenis]